MHNLELNEDQTMILDTVRRFVADSVAAGAVDADEQRRVVRTEFDGLGELGLFGLSLAEDCGGAGMGLLPMVAALEEIGAANGSLARLLIEQTQCALALQGAGAEVLDAIAGGASLAAFVGPEHGIVATGDRLDGAAELVPGAGVADVLVVAATADGKPCLFVVESAACERHELRSLGFASAAPARVTFAGSKATAVATDAAAAIVRARTAAWIGGAAAAVGMAQASIAQASKHAAERIAFGKPLLSQQAVLRKLVESRRAVDGARQLCWHAARVHDLGQDAGVAAMQARIAAVDAAVLAADEGIQIQGGFGYVVEYHVERHYRDAKTLEVLDGGNESLRDGLAAAQFA